jgi:DNA-binding PadR family transcriptional regulator
MALSHAILALLLDNPCSGYDLAKDFDQSVNFFWKATHQQIYRELGKLEEADWVRSEVIAQSGKPDRKLYNITQTGKQHLAEWLLQPCEVMPIKEDLLVKLWAAKLISVADLIERSMSIATLVGEFQRHRQFHVEKLNTFLNIEQTHYGQPKTLSISDKYRYLVLRRGIRYEEDYIGWCDEVLALFSTDLGT